MEPTHYMNNKQKGILYALATALVIGAGYIPAQKSLRMGSAVEVNFIWFLLQLFFYVAVFLIGKNISRVVSKIKKNFKSVFWVGGLSALGAFLWFYEIAAAGAVNTVFILQFTPLVAVLLDIIILKEKFSREELFGGMVAVFGALVFSWNNINLSGGIILLLLFNAVVFAVSNLYAKIYVKNIDPVTLSAGRVFIMVFFFAIAFAGDRQASFIKPADFWTYSFIGSALSVAGFIFFYRSFSFIEASKSQLARTPEPLFTMLFSFLLLGSNPTFFQLVGGFLIVAGVIILIRSKTIISVIPKTV